MTTRIFQTLLLAAFLLSGAIPAAAQRSFSVNISPDGEATLTAFLPEHPDGRAILACPGGGYHQTSIGNNAQCAPLYNSLGISYFILKYRMACALLSKSFSIRSSPSAKDATRAPGTISWGRRPLILCCLSAILRRSKSRRRPRPQSSSRAQTIAGFRPSSMRRLTTSR